MDLFIKFDGRLANEKQRKHCRTQKEQMKGVAPRLGLSESPWESLWHCSWSRPHLRGCSCDTLDGREVAGVLSHLKECQRKLRSWHMWQDPDPRGHACYRSRQRGAHWGQQKESPSLVSRQHPSLTSLNNLSPGKQSPATITGPALKRGFGSERR